MWHPLLNQVLIDFGNAHYGTSLKCWFTTETSKFYLMVTEWELSFGMRNLQQHPVGLFSSPLPAGLCIAFHKGSCPGAVWLLSAQELDASGLHSVGWVRGCFCWARAEHSYHGTSGTGWITAKCIQIYISSFFISQTVGKQQIHSRISTFFARGGGDIAFIESQNH